jgi:eukaryotic-like serine/threonine-protein kinase
MSRVWLAEETRLGRQVVIKVLPPEMGAAVNTERFEREIKLAARLQHPHIVPLLTAGASGDLLYYIMPYIAGESLRVRLGREGELPIGEATRILREITDALAYAHRNGVVHRDIKPDNVLLSEGHAVVTDFGVAKAVSASSGESSLTSLGVALGTPAYMSPEQAAADPHVDHRADIYSLGALAYEMLTARTPFMAPTAQALLAAHITQTPEPVVKHRPAVPAPLNALIMRSLEKHAADRWQSAGEMTAQLDAIATPSGGMAPSGTTPAISSGTEEAIRRSHPLRVAGLFAAAAIGVLAIAYLLVRQLGLPDWVFVGAIVLLLLGLPIILITGQMERRRALARASGRVVATPTGLLPRFFTWRKAILGGVVAFAALGVGTVVYTAMRLLGIGPVGTLVASGRLTERDQLIVADFENRTPDSSLAASVTEAFRIDLTQSPVIRVLSASTVSDALGRMQRDPNTPLNAGLARDVAVREGVKGVIVGDIGSVGRSYVLSVRLLSAADGSELLALRETAADDAGIVQAIDRLSGRVRERIGESLRTIRTGEPLERVTTGSMEALRLYSEGARLSDQGNTDRAISLLEKAIALDSGFAMAWRKLAVALGNSFGSADREAAAATKAYEHRDRLPEVERELATANYFNTVDSRTDRIEASYRRILEIDPTNGVAVNNLGLLLIQTRRFSEAESLVTPALARDPGRGNEYLQVINAQLGQGKTQEARRTIEQMGRALPKSPNYLLARAGGFEIMGQYDSTQRAWVDYGLQLRDPSNQSASHLGLERVARIQGRLAEAERQSRLVAEVSERRGLPGTALLTEVMLAQDYVFFRADTVGALKILQSALARHPLSSLPALERPYPELVAAYALAGQTELARRLLTEYQSSVPEGARRGNAEGYRAAGLVALTTGHPDEAIPAFRAMEEQARCPFCGVWELGLAFERANQPDSALAAYERVADSAGIYTKMIEAPRALAPSLKRLGELYEGRGEKEKAVQSYSRFVDLWKEADPVLQPAVRQAKERLAALSSEPH